MSIWHGANGCLTHYERPNPPTTELIEVRFHFHCTPRSQQTNRYLQIAVSMVIDLGLDQKMADRFEQRTSLPVLDPVLDSAQGRQIDCGTLEAIRAYLGCYYLSYE